VIEHVEFAALFVYSPRGTSSIAVKSRQLRDRIKAGDRELLPLIANRVAQTVEEGAITGFFGSDLTLVPMHGRAPQVGGGLWVPQLMAPCPECGWARRGGPARAAADHGRRKIRVVGRWVATGCAAAFGLGDRTRPFDVSGGLVANAEEGGPTALMLEVSGAVWHGQDLCPRAMVMPRHQTMVD